MARIFGTGFEDNDLTWFTTTNEVVIAATTDLDLDGSYCLKFNGDGHYATKMFSGTYTELYFAFRFRWFSAWNDNSGNQLFQILDSNGDVAMAIHMNVTSYKLYVADGGISATGSAVLAEDHTYLIEVYYKPANTGGVIIIKVDGVVDINETGDSTSNLENIGGIQFGRIATASTYLQYYYIDDFVIDDAGWIGKTNFQLLTATANGTTIQWTPSAGNNYECIDGIPYSDTDYNYTNTTNHVDTFTMSDMSGDVNNIKALYLKVRAGYAGSPTPTKVSGALYINSSVYLATAQDVPSAYAPLFFIWETNPDTSAAFTIEDINDLEAGYKAIA